MYMLSSQSGTACQVSVQPSKAEVEVNANGIRNESLWGVDSLPMYKSDQYA